MKKIMTYAAMMAATAGLFTACSKSDDPIDQQQQAGDTYAAVSIVMNGDNFRASEDPGEDGNYNTPEDPNDPQKPKVWEGKDKIENVNVYIVDVTGDQVSSGEYSLIDFREEKCFWAA